MRIDSSPVYLDTSALAKLYVPETGSDELEAALLGRRDLIVSDLALTELTSAVVRRAREGAMREADVARVFRRALRDLTAGEFLRAELTGNVHREAERLLLGLGARVPLRACRFVALGTCLRPQRTNLDHLRSTAQDSSRRSWLVRSA